VEVITEHIPAQVYDAVMWGYGNQATLNDIILRNDEPLPFIRLYLNDKGEFVIMPFAHCHSSRPKRLLVRQEEIIKEPFMAHTLAINERATEFVHPRRFERTQLWTEGAWGGCCGHGRGHGRIW
jgi:hypothetical protein